MLKKEITLSHGAGGYESGELIELIRSNIQTRKGKWQNLKMDSATLEIGNADLNLNESGHIVYTTDSYTVDPIFFNGGDIGRLSICGTINDLAVMGAKPIGMSLSFLIEEGFLIEDFKRILASIKEIIEKEEIEIVTGDTKVIDKGGIDKIMINTSGIGLADSLFTGDKVVVGDKVIVSRGIAEHGATLLAKRFDMQTDLQSDANPVLSEIELIRNYIKLAKDPTRGGIAALLNEWKDQLNMGFEISENSIPVQKSVHSLCGLTGIDPYTLASEGCFVFIVATEHVDQCLKKLTSAKMIGKIIKDKKIILNTEYGSRELDMPKGRIVPRIC